MRRQAKNFTPHLERYVWCLLYCQDRVVMDAGAKDGYGAHLISRFAKQVTLVDRNEEWLMEGKRYNKFLCPVDFVVADFEKEFPNGKWDVIIAFEVIEHVANCDFFLKNIVDHLNPGGLLLFSVPHMVENLDHKVLFDEEKIKTFISKYLKLEKFYIQNKKAISDEPTLEGLTPKSYVGVAKKI